MKKTLTPEQLERRKKLNKKIFAFGCLPIIILFVLFIWLVNKNTKRATTPEAKERPSYLLTKAEMRQKYPFKIDSLKVLCLEGKKVVVWKQGTSKVWAVNGNALQVAKQNKWGTCKDDNIWNGKSLAFVLNKGLELCE